MVYQYNYNCLFFCVALHLPRPLDSHCQQLAKLLVVAAAESDEYSRLLAELILSSCNGWVRVAQAYSFRQGKANTPCMLFNFWNNKIMKTRQNQSYRTQYVEIQEQIPNKADGLGYTSINMCGLINGLGNIHEHQNASQATNDDITTTTVMDEAGNLAAVSQRRDEGGNEKVGETAA